jgi:hypothetical protein
MISAWFFFMLMTGGLSVIGLSLDMMWGVRCDICKGISDPSLVVISVCW